MLLWLAAAATQPQPQLDQFTPAEIEVIQKHVAIKLLDGESARWKLPPRQHTLWYCGWVNAKNRFGAYVGWKPFQMDVFKYSPEKLFGVHSPPNFFVPGDNSAAENFCREAGYPTLTPPID